MNKRLAFSATALLLFLLSGCISHESMIKKFLPGNVDTFARDLILSAKSQDFKGYMEHIAPSDRTAKLENGLKQVFQYMQNGDLLGVKPVWVRSNKIKGRTTYNITYELHYSRAWQVANIVLLNDGKTITVKGFLVNDIPDSLTVLNAFTFKNKTIMHYLFFILNIAYLLFIGIVFIVCIRTKNLKRKWLWAIICLLGVVEFAFNWTTGGLQVKLFSIGVKVSTFVPVTPYMPSILDFYIPVGAVLFLIKRSKLTNLVEAPVEENETPGISINE